MAQSSLPLVAPATPGNFHALRACTHCGQRIDANTSSQFCCVGCESVHALLQAAHLGRYYQLRGPLGVPVVDAPKRRDRKWLDAISERVATSTSTSRVELDVQGMHCSACVWLLEELFRKQEFGVSLLINPSVGRLVLLIDQRFDLDAFIAKVEAFGYQIGPKRKDEASPSRGLLVRFGVCVALSMNAMIFAIAMYAGLAEGPLHRLFEALELSLGTAAVLVGGSVFFRSAWQAVRQRALHLDLPIAVGIALAYGGSVHAFFAHTPAYFDTLCLFVTLMLLGRFLQQRVLENNRRQLLGDGGAPSLLTRRRNQDGSVRVIACGDLNVGDELMVAPGDLIPVDARLLSSVASCSLDWINGESQPRHYTRGDLLPAGAFNAGDTALAMLVQTDFEHSAITDILRTPARPLGARGVLNPFLRKLAPAYVLAVFVLAAVAFGAWMLATHDLGRALAVTTAMLVVTCPCAFGIATPLAYELVQSGLVRRGLYVRSMDFLDKASRIRKVVFDKTGTLTDGEIEVANPSFVDDLSIAERRMLLAMVQQSSHPKSEAIRRVLEARGIRMAEALESREVIGSGLQSQAGGSTVRLGAPGWAGDGREGDVIFSLDRKTLVSIHTRERLRPGAKAEVSSLASRGYEVWMLSGDQRSRVREVARACGIAETRALGGLTSKNKADWLASHDRQDTLMVGDGINDLEAVAAAFCSGTPAVDRPFVASRADFYFVSAGLAPIRAALDASITLSRVVKRNFVLATAYNVVAVTLVFAGLMSPLLAAILMPVSSLSTILATTFSLSERSRLWRS